jgi:hypothetical protein
LGSSPSTESSSETKGKKKTKPVLGKKKETSTDVTTDSSASAMEIRQQKMRAATAASKALRSLSCSRAVRRDLYLAGGIPLLAHLTTTTITVAPTIQNSARQSATATGTPNTTSIRTPAIPLLPQSLATGNNAAPSISAVNAQQPPNTNKAKYYIYNTTLEVIKLSLMTKFYFYPGH